MCIRGYDEWLTRQDETVICPEPGCEHVSSPDPRDEGYCRECASEMRAQANGDI